MGEFAADDTDGVIPLAWVEAAIERWHAMSEPIAPGDTFSVTAGCDKQFATCKSKFANGLNFRGFPFMPGNDAVLAGPALPLDGGSRYGN